MMADGCLPDKKQRSTNNEMIINRYNYEEYFILYMDNELGSDERCMVETFVQNHPDLKEELDILLQYKLVPDNNIVFEGKDELMKVKGESPVTLSNYEEWLVLYMDNELTTDQRKTLEQFLEANPSVKKEVDLLLRTQLQPETIVFANKEVLYKREEKVRPILWWRAAAAILILALSITSVIVFNKKGNIDKENIAGTNGTEQKTTKENAVVTNKNSSNENMKEENKQVPVPVISNSVENAVAATLRPTTTAKKNNIVPVKMNNNTPTPVKKDEEIMADFKPTNNLPQPLQNRTIITNDVPTKAIAKNDIPDKISNSNISLTNTGVTTKDPQSSDIRTASLINNTDDADFNQPNGKKSKLRGFFRKVTRTFEKRTNIDPTENDEKLLVGGLAIRLK
jgi:hypothetical protein